MPAKQLVAPPPALELESLAIEAGQSWASSFTRDLRGQQRPVVGEWPGTMTEARAWVLAHIAARGAGDRVSVESLRALSRTAYGAARTSWRAVSLRDVEE